MIRWRKMIGLALLSSGVLAGLSAELAAAATSSTPDILSNDRAGDGADSVDIGRVTPITRPAREAAKPLPGGNPLWSIPLSVLSATPERPIFSASRRPLQPAVVAPVEPTGVTAAPAPAEPERPGLALIGAVVGDNDAIAVFLERSSQKIVRLRRGEALGGWVLDAVLRREVTFKRGDQTEILGLQRSEALPLLPASAGPPGLANQPGAPTGNVDLSSVPFTPRSTPKNGEADGL